MFSRRDLLAAGGALAVAALPTLGLARREPKPGRRVLRIAHLTDVHVQPELKAAIGFERCLDAAQTHKPDMIFFGGDMVMDCFNTDLGRAKTQWKLFQDVLRHNTKLPVASVIGNHDIWGWGLPPTDTRHGKRLAMEQLAMEKPFRSFDKAGWHFILLDSVRRKGRNYRACLDDPQFEWLEDDLAKTPKDRPILVMSHIPILTTTQYFFGRTGIQNDWRLPDQWMHVDTPRLKDLFKKHPNVNACIAGHMHMVDEVDYLGVKYMCNGSTSGFWWTGPMQEHGNGYAIVDLYSDGRVVNNYHTFDWKPSRTAG